MPTVLYLLPEFLESLLIHGNLLRHIKENSEIYRICYQAKLNIAEISSGFHQADWSTTLGIVYCYPISFCFGLFVYLFIAQLDSNNKRADANASSI